MSIDPFLLPVPKSLANDPEVADFFNFMARTLNDLTALRGDAIDSVTVTTIDSADVSGGLDLSSITALDEKLDEVIERVALIETALNAILVQKRLDGDIKE